VSALARTSRDFRKRKAGAVRWHVEFEDLPAEARVCRHELSGEVRHRACNHEFSCGTCTSHTEFLSHHTPGRAAEDNVYGLALPGNRMYHRGHTWVQQDDDGTCTVGLDGLAERLWGSESEPDLPPPGTELTANGPGWRMKSRYGSVRILSPLDGIVVETGGKEKGWLLRIRPRRGERSFAHLLRGEEIRPWVMREVERLQSAIAPQGAAPSLADGGDLSNDLRSQTPGANWDAVLGEMFLDS